MTRFETGAALVGIALVFVCLETALHWKSILPAQEVSPVATEEVKNTKTVELDIPKSAQPVIEAKVLAKDFFNEEELQKNGFRLENGRYALALFQHAPVMAQRDSFYLVTFTLHQGSKTIGTISRILPAEEMSAARLFSLVRQKLQTVVTGKETEKFNVSDYYDTAGEANFYLNDKENFPNTTFMITRSKTKVLAFQLIDQYHGAVKDNFIHLFFQ